MTTTDGEVDIGMDPELANELGVDFDPTAHQDRYTWSHEYGKQGIRQSSFMAEFGALNGKFKILQNDSGAYTTFQSQKNTATTKIEKTSAQNAIDQLHLKYGARNSEEFMYRFLVLNAWLYSNLGSLENPEFSRFGISSDIERVKKDVLEFDGKLRKPTFSIDHKKVSALASVKKQARLKVRDTRGSVKFTAGMNIGSGSWSDMFRAGGTGSVLMRTREHTHPLRDGDFRDFEIHVNANVGITPELSQSLAAKLYEEIGVSEIPNYQEHLEQNLGSLSAGTERVFTFRYFKPSQLLFPGLGYRFLYFRQTNVSNFAVKMPKITVYPGVTLGANFESNNTRFGYDEYGSDSIWNYLFRYYHDYGVGFIDEGGELDISGYWLDVERQQRTSLSILFDNFGRECEQNDSPVLNGSMREELLVIEKAFERQRMSEGERVAIRTAKEKFAACAKAFRNANTGANYDQALISFQALMLTYCPHIKKMKKNSPLFNPVKLSLPGT